MLKYIYNILKSLNMTWSLIHCKFMRLFYPSPDENCNFDHLEKQYHTSPTQDARLELCA